MRGRAEQHERERCQQGYGGAEREHHGGSITGVWDGCAHAVRNIHKREDDLVEFFARRALWTRPGESAPQAARRH
ncbi:hypothetical protein GCM10009662_65490 [Catellatospora coxensis]|uniref:Uncharacterized protein n=1 Tax=Catellatospora coxensis TaxID=310354 RepID=A0A8J3KYK7_9ACTN|nr:hypothetical protein Cco03nite_52930 [Catellatospora coxensis]